MSQKFIIVSQKTFHILLATVFAILTIIVSTGCSSRNRVISYSYTPIKNSEWKVQDNLVFDIDTLEESGNYKFSVGIRANNNIQFQKIYVTIEQDFNNPAFYRKDTLEISLTDKMGGIKGRGLRLYNFMQSIKERIPLKAGQTGTVRISHVMRKAVLSGITDVGFRLICEH